MNPSLSAKCVEPLVAKCLQTNQYTDPVDGEQHNNHSLLYYSPFALSVPLCFCIVSLKPLKAHLNKHIND